MSMDIVYEIEEWSKKDGYITLFTALSVLLSQIQDCFSYRLLIKTIGRFIGNEARLAALALIEKKNMGCFNTEEIFEILLLFDEQDSRFKAFNILCTHLVHEEGELDVIFQLFEPNKKNEVSRLLTNTGDASIERQDILSSTLDKLEQEQKKLLETEALLSICQQSLETNERLLKERDITISQLMQEKEVLKAENIDAKELWASQLAKKKARITTFKQQQQMMHHHIDSINELLKWDLPQKHEEEEEERGPICVVCLKEPCTILLNECSHLVLCEDCSKTNLTCPVCRIVNIECRKVFMS
jgi:hypothetical protein